MAIDVKFSADDLMAKPYFTFAEIIELAMNCQLIRESNDFSDVSNFECELISNLKKAILSRKIVPVDLNRVESSSDRYKNNIKPIIIFGGIPVVIFALYFLRHTLNMPEVKQTIALGGGDGDFSGLLSKFGMVLAISALFSLVIIFHKSLKMFFLRLRIKSPREKTNYLLEDAEMLGFTKSHYVRESVIGFLNSNYGPEFIGSQGAAGNTEPDKKSRAEEQETGEEQFNPETSDLFEPVATAPSNSSSVDVELWNKAINLVVDDWFERYDAADNIQVKNAMNNGTKTWPFEIKSVYKALKYISDGCLCISLALEKIILSDMEDEPADFTPEQLSLCEGTKLASTDFLLGSHSFPTDRVKAVKAVVNLTMSTDANTRSRIYKKKEKINSNWIKYWDPSWHKVKCEKHPMSSNAAPPRRNKNSHLSNQL